MNNWIIIIATHISLHKNDIFPFTNDVSLFNYVFFCHLIFFLTAFLHTTILPKRPLRKSPFYTIFGVSFGACTRVQALKMGSNDIFWAVVLVRTFECPIFVVISLKKYQIC